MSSTDPDRQARKFLEQLRIVERERAALYEELLDPESKALAVEYDRLRVELATSEVARKFLQRQLIEANRRLEAVGAVDIDPASTKSRLRNAVGEARAKLRKGFSDEALVILEKVR